MKAKVHKSAARLRRRKARLITLQGRVRQQITDADCLIETLDDYCRENPNDRPCAANDPTWREQLVDQREDLKAMLKAIREKLK